MGKKGKEEAPPEPNPEDLIPVEPEDPPPPAPLPCKILDSLGWQAFTMPATKQRYYYSVRRREARAHPPFYAILGLDEEGYRSHSKADLWKAFYLKRREYKREFDNGSISEELKEHDDENDWCLIMEAFRVLLGEDTRAEYELRNLEPHAKEQLIGLRVYHEVRQREEAAAAAAAEAAKALEEQAAQA
mmetsp:Transcript_45670/g.106009  ORF Transcript_45670/g.106009 Transcript_45670/m.106009 type:complete len:188 (+) Transcript_45670:60-623(+)